MTKQEAQKIVKRIRKQKFKCILPEEAIIALKTLADLSVNSKPVSS